MSDEKSPSMNGSPILLVEVKRGQAQEVLRRFTGTFLVGRTKDCDVRLADDCISRTHVQVILEGQEWRLKDLGSTNGTFLNGERIAEAVLPDHAEIELGRGGPLLALTIERPEPPRPAKTEETMSATRDFASETQIIQKYFSTDSSEPVGEQTLMFRRAFERVQQKKSEKYLSAIAGVLGAAVLIVAIAFGVIHHQKSVIAKQEQRIAALRKTAENIYYAMKALEIQIGQLEDIVMLKADPSQIRNLQEKRRQLGEMSKQYDNFVTEIGVYKKIPVEKQIIYKMARTFGECDVNVPQPFVNEVIRYVGIWKRSAGTLKGSLQSAQAKGYTQMIVKDLKEQNLPRHFMFLALRESDFNPMAVGRLTRYGYAKGMWQFIPETAQHYGLTIGPMYGTNAYDPYDERFYPAKASKAAARYIRDINNTDAQASGLLVMASYNWGEGNVRAIIARMPGNPRDRNFWRLLQTARIPRETYDYVLSIFSAAVICENPRLFGFDFDTPRFSEEGM